MLTTALMLGLAWVGEPSFDDPDRRATKAALPQLALALTESLNAKGVTLPVGRVIPLPEIAARLKKKRLAKPDAWGRPYYVVQTARQLAVGSAGPDGKADPDLIGFDARGAIVHDVLPAEADDLVWIDGIFVANDVDVEQARRRRTAWRLTLISQWIDLHYPSGGPYPGAGRGTIEIEELEGVLAADGRGTELPRRDAWGRAIYYTSDGDRYVLTSQGAGPDDKDDVTLRGPGLVFEPG